MSDKKFVSGNAESTLVAVVAGIVLLGGLSLFWIWPNYQVWSKSKNGEATLAEAEFTRKTRVAEAQAKLDSAKLEAQAVVTKAEGQAKANQEISASLTPAVLQYQYLNMLEEQGNGNGERTVVYIPTNPNTGMPVSLPAPESFRLQGDKKP